MVPGARVAVVQLSVNPDERPKIKGIVVRAILPCRFKKKDRI